MVSFCKTQTAGLKASDFFGHARGSFMFWVNKSEALQPIRTIKVNLETVTEVVKQQLWW